MKANLIDCIESLRHHYLQQGQQLTVIVTPHSFTLSYQPYYAPNGVSVPAAAKTLPPRATPSPARRLPKSTGNVPSGEHVLAGSHTSKWWSRYHFEKNLMTLAFSKLTEDSPATRFISTTVAATLTRIMNLSLGTAKRHITRAIKLGILIKEKDGANTMLSLNKPEPTEGSSVNNSDGLEKARADFQEALEGFQEDETVIP